MLKLKETAFILLDLYMRSSLCTDDNCDTTQIIVIKTQTPSVKRSKLYQSICHFASPLANTYYRDKCTKVLSILGLYTRDSSRCWLQILCPNVRFLGHHLLSFLYFSLFLSFYLFICWFFWFYIR